MSVAIPTYLLDTGWIVRHLRGRHPYTEAIARRAGDGLAVSIISVAELQEGVALAKDRERAAQSLATFLTTVTILFVEDETCRIFGELSAELETWPEIPISSHALRVCEEIGGPWRLMLRQAQHERWFPQILSDFFRSP